MHHLKLDMVYIYYVAMVMAGLFILHIHLINIQLYIIQKFMKFERKYRDFIRNGEKIGTETCYDIST